jgi:hypothetical protein
MRADNEKRNAISCFISFMSADVAAALGFRSPSNLNGLVCKIMNGQTLLEETAPRIMLMSSKIMLLFYWRFAFVPST